jgi:hypothetical protein
MAGRRAAQVERRAWLEHPGAAQRVAELVGCQVQDVVDATVEDLPGHAQQVVTVTVVKRISPRDARVLVQGTDLGPQRG